MIVHVGGILLGVAHHGAVGQYDGEAGRRAPTGLFADAVDGSRLKRPQVRFDLGAQQGNAVFEVAGRLFQNRQL